MTIELTVPHCHKKIGLFGGSFDPVHYGHVAVAEFAFSELSLDYVVWIPAGYPWQKQGACESAQHRLAMLKRLVSQHPKWQLDEQELRREGASYTIDTIEKWQALYPNAELWCIVGEDAWQGIHTWHRWRELIELASFAVLARACSDRAPEYLSELAEKAKFISMPLHPASSSEIRRLLSKGDFLSPHLISWLPDSVYQYITANRLYFSK